MVIERLRLAPQLLSQSFAIQLLALGRHTRSYPLPTFPPHSQLTRVQRQHGEAIAAGIRLGLQLASAFSIFVVVMAIVRRSTHYDSYGGLSTWQVIAFYYAAGLVGGALFGALQPWRTRYAGRFLTAYLILFLVYGGGTAVFLPMFHATGERPVPLSVMLKVWACVCLVLAPLYVATFNKSDT